MKQVYFRILFISFLLLFYSSENYAQRKPEKKAMKRLKADIEYLASDELEGRRTGSEGEHKAASYIEERYKKLKIDPYKGQYKHPFQFVYGKEISDATQIRIGNTIMKMNEDVFPLPFSANTAKKLQNDVLPDVFEPGSIINQTLFRSP